FPTTRNAAGGSCPIADVEDPSTRDIHAFASAGLRSRTTVAVLCGERVASIPPSPLEVTLYEIDLAAASASAASWSLAFAAGSGSAAAMLATARIAAMDVRVSM